MPYQRGRATGAKTNIAFNVAIVFSLRTRPEESGHTLGYMLILDRKPAEQMHRPPFLPFPFLSFFLFLFSFFFFSTQRQATISRVYNTREREREGRGREHSRRESFFDKAAKEDINGGSGHGGRVHARGGAFVIRQRTQIVQLSTPLLISGDTGPPIHSSTLASGWIANFEKYNWYGLSFILF